MQFEVSERITSTAPKEAILFALDQQFRKTANYVDQYSGAINIATVEASFGSINRTDRATIQVKEKDGGYVITAAVSYNPSIWFWIFEIVGLFTAIFWIFPIIFFIIQKNTVKQSIESTFLQVKNEFDNFKPATVKNDSASELESLHSLKLKGIITQEEFNFKKAKILGI